MVKSSLVSYFKELYCRFIDDDIPALGAQMTYYLILSFFPFLIFLLTVLSYTPLTTNKDILFNLSRLLPTDTYLAISGTVGEIIASRSNTLLSFGMVATIWLSVNGIAALIRGLNKAYNQEEKRPFWKTRLLSLLIMFFLIIAILFSFIMLVFGEVLGRYVFTFLGYPLLFAKIWSVARFLVPIATLLLIFVFLYTIAPSRSMRIREVIPGAAFTTFGWIVLSIGFSYYVNNFSSYSLTYGSIGGVIVLLIWIYWSSLIILLGGELNAALTFNKEGLKKPRCKKF